MSNRKNIAIIGGGPGGLMTAEVLAQAGHTVTIYERKPTAGRKFMMAGRGGLNITHSEPFDLFITRYGDAANWLRPALEAFTPSDLRAWCDGLGQETFIGSSGRVFPKSLKASPLLRAWLARLAQLGVTIHTNHQWQGWDEQGRLLINGAAHTPDITFLALGGASWPRLGSDGEWTEWLARRGIQIKPFAPANCGFLIPWSQHFSQRYAGQPLKPVVLHHNGHQVQGEIMITATGLEGGAVYALSRFIRTSIEQEGQALLHLDLRPGLSESELAKRLANRGSQSFSTWLKKAGGLSPCAAALVLDVLSADKRNTLSPNQLAHQIKALPLPTRQTAGLDRAISSAGGIMREEVDDTFQLKKLPGVYALGEMLDWEAPTGGYLLQATFSMAVKAARSFA